MCSPIQALPIRPFEQGKMAATENGTLQHINKAKRIISSLAPPLHMPAPDLPANLGPSVYKISPVEGRAMSKVKLPIFALCELHFREES
jgi:hypothetical protein